MKNTLTLGFKRLLALVTAIGVLLLWALGLLIAMRWGLYEPGCFVSDCTESFPVGGKILASVSMIFSALVAWLFLGALSVGGDSEKV